MKAGIVGVLALLFVGNGLMASPAMAKCTRDCKRTIRSDFRTCKSACPKGKAGRTCHKTCLTDKKTATAACKAATNPTPPTCSPSGAFVD
jgi:hypothetical protein